MPDTIEIRAEIFTGVDNIIMGTALNWLNYTWDEFCAKVEMKPEDLAERRAELESLIKRFDPIADAG